MASTDVRLDDDEGYLGRRPRPLTVAATSERRRRPLRPSPNEVRVAFSPAPGDGRAELRLLWKRARPSYRRTSQVAGIAFVALGVIAVTDGDWLVGVALIVIGLMQAVDLLAARSTARVLRRLGGARKIEARVGPLGVDWSRAGEEHHHDWAATQTVFGRDGTVVFAFRGGGYLGIPGRVLSAADVEQIRELASDVPRVNPVARK